MKLEIQSVSHQIFSGEWFLPVALEERREKDSMITRRKSLMSRSQNVLLELQGKVGLVVINRPEKRNALDQETLNDL
jgi:hypothetical protein